ncbi:DNA-(apurinic or apyrimidinic site) lyase /endonuclease III [Proteiniborus ethanoligenes]|uniref:Endonuclease III n=1 Tax=Proteiniborus ethanoligenes TaxID=415015 RepID=A0A1H3SB36_9FIRM|nr:DNA-(apurinic or apyrimidinic site) lyase /endonuclease III [Proteiniborus ethanoligenes]
MKNILNNNHIKEVLKILEDTYPDAACELVHSSPFELLIATILSAQSTDKRVNIVTNHLFQEFNTPGDFLRLTEDELAEKIRTIGFYRAKSKNILKTCKILVEEYNSKVPSSREELVKLPGVGRKTANVVISNAFGQNAIAVDTHVFRVANRIGLADSQDVNGTEEDLMNNINEEFWTKAHHLLIFHGRRVCKARKPMCGECPLVEFCLYYKQNFGK